MNDISSQFSNLGKMPAVALSLFMAAQSAMADMPAPDCPDSPIEQGFTHSISNQTGIFALKVDAQSREVTAVCNAMAMGFDATDVLNSRTMSLNTQGMTDLERFDAFESITPSRYVVLQEDQLFQNANGIIQLTDDAPMTIDAYVEMQRNRVIESMGQSRPSESTFSLGGGQ